MTSCHCSSLNIAIMDTPTVQDPPAHAIEQGLLDKTADLTVQEGQAPPATDLPAHRSHDPQNNQKRTDPFQFGSRYLQQEDDVFEFNAWDHVETDDTYKEYAEQQYEMQRQSPVSDFDKSEYTIHPMRSRNSSRGIPPAFYDDITNLRIVHLNLCDDNCLF